MSRELTFEHELFLNREIVARSFLYGLRHRSKEMKEVTSDATRTNEIVHRNGLITVFFAACGYTVGLFLSHVLTDNSALFYGPNSRAGLVHYFIRDAPVSRRLVLI
jgi:hypothetical protein